MPVVCPGCGAEMDPSSRSCPICLRPRSRKEIFAGLRDKSARGPGSRIRRLRAAFWLSLAMGAIAYGYQVGLLKRLTLPAKPGTPSQEEGPQSADQPVGEAQEEDAARPSLMDWLSRKAAHPFSPEVEGPYWTIHGTLYDLKDLSPVADAHLVFRDRSSGSEFRVRTNFRGRYSARLPSRSDWGYDLSLRHKNYDGEYLEDMEPSYRDQSPESRKEALDQISTSKMLHLPILIPEEKGSLEHNLYLLHRASKKRQRSGLTPAR